MKTVKKTTLPRSKKSNQKTADPSLTYYKYTVGGAVYETFGNWAELPLFLELTPDKVKNKATVTMERDGKKFERTYFPQQFRKMLSNEISRQVAFKQISMFLK